MSEVVRLPEYQALDECKSPTFHRPGSPLPPTHFIFTHSAPPVWRGQHMSLFLAPNSTHPLRIPCLIEERESQIRFSPSQPTWNSSGRTAEGRTYFGWVNRTQSIGGGPIKFKRRLATLFSHHSRFFFLLPPLSRPSTLSPIFSSFEPLVCPSDSVRAFPLIKGFS